MYTRCLPDSAGTHETLAHQILCFCSRPAFQWSGSRANVQIQINLLNNTAASSCARGRLLTHAAWDFVVVILFVQYMDMLQLSALGGLICSHSGRKHQTTWTQSFSFLTRWQEEPIIIIIIWPHATARVFNIKHYFNQKLSQNLSNSWSATNNRLAVCQSNFWQNLCWCKSKLLRTIARHPQTHSDRDEISRRISTSPLAPFSITKPKKSPKLEFAVQAIGRRPW